MKSKYFFIHDQSGRRTIAIDKPDSKALLAAAIYHLSGEDPEIVLNVGTTKVHRKDQYNKKTGRELAITKLSPVKFKLESIVMFDTEADRVSMIYNDGASIFFRAEVNRKTKKLRMYPL